MKAHLAKVSLALLSTVILLGCQEQGPVGPDGSVPLFHGKPCQGPHKNDEGCNGGGGNSEAFELDLAGGMTTTGFDVGGTSSIFALQSGNFSEDIVLDFGDYEFADCEIIRGTGGVHHAPTIEKVYADRLLLELSGTMVTNGIFGMDIDLTGLAPGGPTTPTPLFLEVNYDNEFGKRSVVALFGGDDATARWVSDSGSVDVFELAGPVTVAIRGVTGGKGKKSNRTIRCGGAGDNVVTATVTRPAA